MGATTAEQDIKITYEVLFDLFRREKNREELQKLDNTFYDDILSYISEKNNILQEKIVRKESKDEIKKVTLQIENIQKILRELYDRREKKIVVMSINQVRIPHSLINTSALLPEERLLFEQLKHDLEHYRTEVLDKLLQEKRPNLVQEEKRAGLGAVQQPDFEQKGQQLNQQSSVVSLYKTVKFLAAVPKFIGEEMEIYGPYQEHDIAQLPHKIAEILIHKGRAEEVHSEQRGQQTALDKDQELVS